MSVLEEITKLLEIKEKKYLYLKILSYIYQKPDSYITEIQNQIKNIKIMYNYIRAILENHLNQNNIKINISENDKNNFREIEKYFIKVIEDFENKKENLRVEQLTILKNLLSNKKSYKIIVRKLEPNNIFTIKNFIIYYSKFAIDKLFIKDFNQNVYNELNNIYLSLIFQSKDKEYLQRLKIIIYKYLYEYNNTNTNTINTFIVNSSNEIFKKEPDNDKNLLYFQNKYNEINLDKIKVSDNIKDYFGKNLQKNTLDILNFFDINNIKKNSIYLDNKVENTDTLEENIVIDDLNYNPNKIHLFSPEFLIVNGFKSKIEECDFQIFNKGNYNIEQFSKFLKKIIDNLNDFIKSNNKCDFLSSHLVEVKKKDFNHYISANLGYDDKMELKKINGIYNNQNLSIKINVYQNNVFDKKIINNNDNDSNKTSSLSRTIMSNSDINKDSSDQFEYIVNNLLKGNIEKDKLINLANILYKFNFKLMKYNDKNNTIKFVSAYLNHISKKKDENPSENSKTNYCYGFKEIDSIFQHNLNKFTCVDDLDYFDINLIYIKEEKNEYFKIIDKKEKKLAIYPNSIFFFVRLKTLFLLLIFLLEMKKL